MAHGSRWRLLSSPAAGLASVTLVAGLALAGSTALPGSAGAAEVEPRVLDELVAEGSTTFWVYLREQADLRAAARAADRSAQGRSVYAELTETAQASQATLRAMLDAENAEYEAFWIANTVKVSGDDELLARITALAEVEQVTADRVYELPEPPAMPETEQARTAAVEWNLDRINAPQAWDEFGATGEGIVVASIDTGVQYDHPALVAQYRGNQGDGGFDHNYNWWDPSRICGSSSLAPCDNIGHGTHVTGTMAGDDGDGNRVGVAPGAQWIAAKGCEGLTCSQSALLSSGQFVLAPTDLQGNNPDPDRRPHVVNNSWGGAATTDPWFQPTVQAWVAAGIFPQFSAGNTPSGVAACGSASNPGNLPESYAAGAFDIDNAIADLSNRGPSAFGGGLIKPNIAAPGIDVRSSLPGNVYGPASGTSMASPHVAGTVALMWSAAVALERDIEATRELLGLTAIDVEDLTCGGEPDHNNVWGQGRLDAFAAVEQSPRGPVGVLTGTVTDGERPITGATVSIAGELDRQRITGSDGAYSIILPAGEHTVAASAFGYRTQTADVAVAEGQTTTRDFDLEAVETVTVSGRVTDGSGHGWPLYARVSATGTPVSTFTDPVTGEYRLSLPAGETYTLVAQPQYPGYAERSEAIDVGGSDLTLDLALVVDRCDLAPGYQQGATIAMLTTDPGGQFADWFASRGVAVDFFTAAQLDQISGYDVVLWGYNASAVSQAAFQSFLDATDAGGVGVVFLDHVSTIWNGIKTLSRLTGNPASVAINTAGAGRENFYEVIAEHEILNGFEVGDQIIHEPGQTAAWVAWFDGYEGEGRQVIADAGRTLDGTLGSGIGVQQRENNRHVLLSMHSSAATSRGPDDWSAESEQIFWNALDWASPVSLCVPTEGGLVLGHVTDLNTDAGVNGATVASVGNPDEAGTSFATPDDPAMDDGFFWLFSSRTGSQQFTASARGYVDEAQTVDVAADATNEVAIALAAGQLTIDPAQVTAELSFGETANRTVTITNTGAAPVELELGERRDTFETLGGGQPASGAGAWEAPAGLVPNPDYDPNSLTTEGQYLEDPTPAPAWSVAAAGDIIRSWRPSGLALAWGVGYDDTVWLSDIPTSNHNHEFAVDGSATGARHATPWADSWPADMSDLSATEMCQVNVGGDNGIHCWRGSSGTVTRAMAGAFPWTVISQRGLAYRPDDDTFYIGGWNQNILYQVRGFSHATPGEVVHQCSFPGMGISGLAWNPTAELLWIATNSATDTIWSVNPDDCTVTGSLGHPTPGGNGGGLHLDGNGDLWMVSLDNGGAENRAYLMESGVPHRPDVDVPWLAHSPQSASLEPGESMTVTVSLDSGVDEVDQPGTYAAGLGIRHDTPYLLPPVDVSMVVTPPPTWGKITGAVTGVSCEGEESSPSGAMVQVSGEDTQLALPVGPDGSYSYWFPVDHNPLTLIVWATDHVPQTRDTQIKPRQETVENFTLEASDCLAGGANHPIWLEQQGRRR